MYPVEHDERLPTPADDAERGVPRETVAGFAAAIVEVKAVSHWWAVEPLPAPTSQVAFPLGVLSLTIVTACNPGGRRLPAPDNMERDASLRARLDRTDLVWWPAINRAPDDDGWTERSVAIADLSLDDGVALAHDLHQAALFVWTPGFLDLVWVPRAGRVTADRRHALTTRRSAGGG